MRSLIRFYYTSRETEECTEIWTPKLYGKAAEEEDLHIFIQTVIRGSTHLKSKLNRQLDLYSWFEMEVLDLDILSVRWWCRNRFLGLLRPRAKAKNIANILMLTHVPCFIVTQKKLCCIPVSIYQCWWSYSKQFLILSTLRRMIFLGRGGWSCVVECSQLHQLAQNIHSHGSAAEP